MDNKIDVSEPSYINNILSLDPNNNNDADHSVDDIGDFNIINEEEDHIDPINLFDSIFHQNVDFISILDINVRDLTII